MPTLLLKAILLPKRPALLHSAEQQLKGHHARLEYSEGRPHVTTNFYSGGTATNRLKRLPWRAFRAAMSALQCSSQASSCARRCVLVTLPAPRPALASALSSIAFTALLTLVSRRLPSMALQGTGN